MLASMRWLWCGEKCEGDDSARWPNSIPPGGVAQEVLLIPASGSELGVVCGGVEQNYLNGSGMSRSGL